MSRMDAPPVSGGVELGSSKVFQPWWIRWINVLYKIIQGVELYPTSILIHPGNGESYQIPNDIGNLVIDPVSPLASFGVLLPPHPINNQEIRISSSQEITNFVVSSSIPISNQTAELTPGSSTTYRYIQENNTWFKVGAGGAGGSGGGGTVTSVGLQMPAIFDVQNSPITGSGEIIVGLQSTQANKIFVGPASGADADPTFRIMVPADMPVAQASGPSHAAGAVPDPGASAGITKFLREDMTFAVPGGAGGGADETLFWMSC